MNHPTAFLRQGVLAVLLLNACSGSSVPPSVLEGSTRQASSSASGSSATCDDTHTVSCGGVSQCCGTGDACVISVMGTAGNFFCATCPAEFPAACSKTTCCRTATGCDTNFRNSTFGSCLCPSGQTPCGDVCCPAGATCEAGVCLGCPASAPHRCGDECRSTECTSGGGGECPVDTRACPDGASCCPLGSKCCQGGGCCPPSTPYLGGARCYTSLADCQAAGNNRCASCQG
jgi:hypothetical protein